MFVLKPASPLPVELLSFDAENLEEAVITSWETNIEIGNDYFTVQRSKDAKNWENIGIVDGAGYSNEKLSYSFRDQSPLNGISYYRLQQTDFDGAISHSGTKAVKRDLPGGGQSVHIYPNPTQDRITIESTNLSLEDIYIFDALGKDITRSVDIVTLTENVFGVDLSNIAGSMFIVKTPYGMEKVVKL